MFTIMQEVALWQWGLILLSSVLFFWLSPFAKTKTQFFKATYTDEFSSVWKLTGSLIISWIFAKSITNAANLGMSFGLLGGLAYAGYYLSFAVAGILIYRMRKKGGFTSIHHFLVTSFGKGAVYVFSILISIRLFNEVWSNTMVIGTYFGSEGSLPYYSSIVVFTFLTLGYALKGGLSSSIFTDTIQMILFSMLLAVILWSIFRVEEFSVSTVIHSGEWTMEMGGNLLIAALLQSFSYPFHDPVLTDRGFIASPKATLKSFLWASILGGGCIVLFSIVGIYAQHEGMEGQAAVAVSQSFGLVILLMINFIMITSAASTLDSTFSSFSKLMTIDLKLGEGLRFGRLTMVVIALLGTIPVFFGAEILSATTISGTMVIGLSPVFLLWKKDAPKSSFYLSLCCGLFFGLLLVFDAFPNSLVFTKGKYAALLWSNIWGIGSCFIVYFIPIWLQKQKR